MISDNLAVCPEMLALPATGMTRFYGTEIKMQESG
tara:strand:+ start:460 stop:564 length:105 start_codon:yes stop_codon:yes gene_type:complete